MLRQSTQERGDQSAAPAASGAPDLIAAKGKAEGMQVQPDPSAGEVSEEMLHAMGRDLKLTTQQAKARLVRSDWAARLGPPPSPG